MPTLPSNDRQPPESLRESTASWGRSAGPETLGEALREPTPASRVFAVLGAVGQYLGWLKWWGPAALAVGILAIVVIELIRVRKAVKTIEEPPARSVPE